MFERWDQKRGIIADDMSDFDRSLLFISLAAEIYGKPSLAGGVTRQWLEASLQNTFTEIFENKARAFKAARAFVEFVTGRAWVMTEVGENVFSFTHQTFLEYFFARNLEDKHDSVADLFKTLKPRILRREWNEVAHLALQLKTHRSLRRQEEALRMLRGYISQTRIPKQQAAILSFSARALEYLSPSEASLSAFLDDVVDVVKRRCKNGESQSFSFIAQIAKMARARGEYVRQRLGHILQSSILGDDPMFAKAAARLVTGHSGDIQNGNDAERSYELPLKMRKTIIANLREPILERADRDVTPVFSSIWS
jgi:hypothetical protein